MSTEAQADAPPSLVEIWRRRNWFLALGALLMVLGAAAVVAAFATTLVTIALLGALLLAGGAVQAVHAFRLWGNGAGSFIPALAGGVLYVVAGALLLASPRWAALVVTLLMAATLAASGLVRLGWALFSGAPGRGVAAANGVLELALGVLVWAGWPATGLWVLGACVGVDLVADLSTRVR